jgi:hypothetical protein
MVKERKKERNKERNKERKQQARKAKSKTYTVGTYSPGKAFVV